MPFTRHDTIQPFDTDQQAAKVDIGSVCAADTNEHTGAIYLTLYTANGEGISLIVPREDIDRFLSAISFAAYVASRPASEQTTSFSFANSTPRAN